MNLPKIDPIVKSGEEHFVFEKSDLNIPLLEFWKWNQSNLLENRTRGILAEFIVKKALDVKVKQELNGMISIL